MGTREEAVRLHGEGFNCAQCVFCACGKYTGLDDKSALAIAGGFGGGVRCGEICGAISGAVMAIGAAAPFARAFSRTVRSGSDGMLDSGASVLTTVKSTPSDASIFALLGLPLASTSFMPRKEVTARQAARNCLYMPYAPIIQKPRARHNRRGPFQPPRPVF